MGLGRGGARGWLTTAVVAMVTAGAVAGCGNGATTTTASPSAKAASSTSSATKTPATTTSTQGGTASGTAKPTNAPSTVDGFKTCPLSTLPSEAADISRLITAGGPFANPGKDGSTFGNFEGRLPKQRSGYYREYTVPTPDLNHRGARRIVTGGSKATTPERMYYSGDHYETFCIVT